MASHIRFQEGAESSDYDPTDSDEDYAENEKLLLNKVRTRKSARSDSEEEVLGVAADDSEQSDIALSDVEGLEDDDELPDVKAWGKQKKRFYSADYVDQDYGGYDAKDVQMAELEEEEARNLQKQLIEQLDDDDFKLDLVQNVEFDQKEVEEVVKSDLSKLSKRQKLQILQKESPEFFGLIEDFQAKIGTARDWLAPVLKKYTNGDIPNCDAIDFVYTHHELILNYCINIYFYLVLKASRANLSNHPISKRLYQYRQLLSQLEPVYEEKIKPQLEMLLQEGDETVKEPLVHKKTLSILKNLDKKSTSKTKETKSLRFADNKSEVEEMNVEQPAEEVAENESQEAAKRAISYKMAKNKGLTPHRKKEQRNPRVKHRNKFRKAKIRRKGAVREPRTELKRYGGEMSGIKINVSKSVKIKT